MYKCFIEKNFKPRLSNSAGENRQGNLTEKCTFLMVISVSNLLLGRKFRLTKVCLSIVRIKSIGCSAKLYSLALNILPVTIGETACGIFVCMADIVNKTPALVPTQTKSLHANNDVTLKHAALCCRIISSQFDNILLTGGARFTSNN